MRFFVGVPLSPGRSHSSSDAPFGHRPLQAVLQSLQQLLLVVVRIARRELVQLSRIRHRDTRLARGPAHGALTRRLGRLGLARALLVRPLSSLRLSFRFARPLLGLSSPNSLGLARPLRSDPSPLRFFLAPSPRGLDLRRPVCWSRLVGFGRFLCALALRASRSTAAVCACTLRYSMSRRRPWLLSRTRQFEPQSRTSRPASARGNFDNLAR